MNSCVVLLLCSVLGSTFGYYVQRASPYNVGPNDPYPIEVSPYLLQEPSQRLFWGNQGSNQVGGTGWWASLTNKFPFLGNMFGRMELPAQYGVPSQVVPTQYGVPPQELSTKYGAPGNYQPQFFSSPSSFFRSQPNHFSGRDVALTDDAVIITPPQVPILPSAPMPAPAPLPPPTPVPEPSTGYQYNKPQYRLDLPHK
ncbi:hypothetical protein ACJJTC_007925 [Scirpophaga incertulas]